jgi:hypothetical protein
MLEPLKLRNAITEYTNQQSPSALPVALYFTTSYGIDAQDWQDWIMAAPADAHQIHFTNPVCGKNGVKNRLDRLLENSLL